MSLQVPSYTAPISRSPFVNAYAFITGLTIDFAGGHELLVVAVHRSSQDGNAVPPPNPIDQLQLLLGAPINPSDSGSAVMPTMAQLVTAAAALQQATPTLDPMTALRNAIYNALAALPIFAGATEVA